MRTVIPVFLLLTLSTAALASETNGEQPLFTMDDNVWAAFYDVPSRRFRAIRDAFIRRDFAVASSDLATALAFLQIEADRAVPELQAPLSEVIEQLQSIRSRMDQPAVSVRDLDARFARAHWLLAQHYLALAQQSRDAGRHKSAGRYLWATAHHLERAVLWSDARIDDAVVTALESTRDLAVKLQNSPAPERVYRQRPIRLAARTLGRVGEHLDRKVWIAEIVDSETR